MKRQIWTSGVAAAALAFGVSMAAQTSSTAQTASPGTVTVTGCLQRGDSAGGATGTSGSATSSSAASSSDKFVLANAHMGSGASSTPGATGATTGTSGSATSSSGSSMSGAKYELEGSATELKDHVGHEVEIKGRIENSSSATTGSAATGSATSSSASSSQKLTVESVRMIASTCSAK
ncbi:MAG TPA: hypothetical protein VGJ29_21455 [Vicinamibacterales bacterium]